MVNAGADREMQMGAVNPIDTGPTAPPGDGADQTGIGDRLRDAILRWGSIRRFHREMRGRGVRGSSYPRIHAYLKGVVQPSHSFLERAAEILGVRAPWLIRGEGEPTFAEEVVERTVREDRYESVAAKVDELIAQEFPVYRKLPAAARALVWETFQDHNGHALSVSIFTGQEKLSHTTVARRLGRALMTPLLALQIDPERLPSRQVGEYAEIMCQALKTLVPEPFARGPHTVLAGEDDSAEWSEAMILARAPYR